MRPPPLPRCPVRPLIVASCRCRCVLQGDLTDATMISVSTVQNIMGLIFTLTIFLGMVSQRVYGWGGRGGVLLAGVLVHRLLLPWR